MKPILATLFMSLFIYFPSFAQEKVERSFDGVNSIRLNTASGDCNVRKGSDQQVNVLVEFTYDPDDFEVKMEKNGSRLFLEEKFNARSMSGRSEWTLTVPDGIEFDITSGSGSLEMSELQAEVKFSTGSGNADVNRMSGELEFNSGSGDFTFEEVSGEIKANSGSGDHKFIDVTAEIEANSGSGDVEVESSEGEFQMNAGSGDVEAEQISLKGDGDFNSGSGDVKIILKTSPDHDIALSSGSGDAILDFNGQKIEGNIIMKAKKRGGEIKAPFEFDKVEEVEESGQIYIKKTKKMGSKNIEIYVGTGTGSAVIRE